MAIPDRLRQQTEDPRYLLLQTDDGSFTLEETATGNTFHSGCGAVAECLHVYAENSGITQRLKTCGSAKVLELGFGTGLAFLVTASIAQRQAARLQYVSLESSPLPVSVCSAVLQNSLHVEPLNENLARDLLAGLAEIEEKGWHRREDLSLGSNTISLSILTTNICSASIPQLDVAQPQGYDAVYFDPFDPLSNPEAWSPETYQKMYDSLRPGGRLVSYCVKSEVRRQLVQVGFQVNRVPGPIGGKREVLIASRP